MNQSHYCRSDGSKLLVTRLLHAREFRCWVCGDPATLSVGTVEELPPERDEHGQLWENSRVVTGRCYCPAHEQLSAEQSCPRSLV